MIKDASEEQVYGIIKIGGKIVNAVRFADDEAITASSRTRANDESSWYHRKVWNENKCKENKSNGDKAQTRKESEDYLSILSI